MSILGNYPVRRGFRQYIDYESCPVDRYQPFLFWSNEDHQCQIVKSLCSEEGQVQYDNGTTTSDKGCRCDYTRGYDFLVRPKNKCFCVSSEEDCSCLQNSNKETHRHNAGKALKYSIHLKTFQTLNIRFSPQKNIMMYCWLLFVDILGFGAIRSLNFLKLSI